MELLLKINSFEQTMITVIAVQFVGFLLIYIWTKKDERKNN